MGGFGASVDPLTQVKTFNIDDEFDLDEILKQISKDLDRDATRLIHNGHGNAKKRERDEKRRATIASKKAKQDK